MPTSSDRVLKPVRNLPVQLADRLRERLLAGEWQAGDRLPTEGQLGQEYGVSRSTVRGALQLLENQGRTRTRHGLGTFVAAFGGEIKTSLPELQSMSDIIRAHGFEPQMRFDTAEVRPATDVERARLQLDRDTTDVFATQRAVLADGEAVAFSDDQIPVGVLGRDFDPVTVDGSLFELLRAHDVAPTTSVADIHAVSATSIGWGVHHPGSIFLLLDQIHYTDKGLAVLASKTYFAEGRFQFSVLRVR
ncbi:GntR family transcriptional regulator [Nakamurella sp. UYEF19]|uniref:GntR family transcriptional regulator n=1 Tax=Nakamurella sp. UYEF19 TaxID=1756392 RepID=UPI003394FA63